MHAANVYLLVVSSVVTYKADIYYDKQILM